MKVVPCPMCGQPSPWEGNPCRPFCSDACRDKDLGKWATEAYRVPGPSLGDLPEEDETKPRNGEE